MRHSTKAKFGTSVVVEGQVTVQSEKIGVITSRLWSFCVPNFHCGIVCLLPVGIINKSHLFL